MTIPAIQNPSISLTKAANITSFSAPGVPVTYTYDVTNNGNVTLTDVGVNDVPLGAIDCPNSTLAVGAIEVCSASYTTTQADVDKGSITNTATATGTSPEGTVVTNPSTVTIPGVSTPGITITKTADIPSFAAANTTIIYSYLVTNTGNVTLTSVGVTDPMAGLSAPSLPRRHAAAGLSRNLHRHLHHHPDRRGQRQHHQHRHGVR